jgi:hypothetical protein
LSCCGTDAGHHTSLVNVTRRCWRQCMQRGNDCITLLALCDWPAGQDRHHHPFTTSLSAGKDRCTRHDAVDATHKRLTWRHDQPRSHKRDQTLAECWVRFWLQHLCAGLADVGGVTTLAVHAFDMATCQLYWCSNSPRSPRQPASEHQDKLCRAKWILFVTFSSVRIQRLRFTGHG